MGNFYTCGPNKAMVISGGCFGVKKKKYIVGGYAFAWWYVTDVQFLSLELLSVNVVCQDGETMHGVAVTVSAAAQCKVIKEIDFLKIAAEQFLGVNIQTINAHIGNTLQGSLRAILGTLTVEEIYKDREAFSRRVREVAAPDMARMGIAIVSFIIWDIWDNVNYLASLGKPRIAAVKRDAAVGVAQAERDAGIREAECEKEAQNVVFEMKTRIENHSGQFNMAKAAFDLEVNTAKAEAALAYELQAARVQQNIRNEEVQIDIIERGKEAEVESKEVERKDKELSSTVRLPAEAESYRIQTIAEGKTSQTAQEAKAMADRIRLMGDSEASVLKVVGTAEAALMSLKAKVFQTYGVAATTSLALEAMPQITSSIALPLKNINEMVIIGGSDGVTSDLNRLLGQIPPSVSAIAGDVIERCGLRK